ncbi:MAG: amidase family protein, partial [Bacteroidota bacterium]
MKRILQYLTSPLFFVILIVTFSNFSCSNEPGEDRLAGTDEFTLLEMNIPTLQEGYQNGTFTTTEVVELYLKRIELIDRGGPKLNSVITINPDAVSIAGELDREREQGISRGPLHGVPVLLKDNIDTHDKMPTTAGSRALQ